MDVFRVRVEYADGDDFAAPRLTSHVEVEADCYLHAKLAAEQMVLTPMPGKPGHIQITGTYVEP